MGAFSDGLGKRVRKTGGAGTGPAVPRGMTEEEFFSARRMFCVAPGGLRVASAGDTRNHRRWMSDLTADEFDRAPRGYLLGKDLVVYRGEFLGVSPRLIERILPGIVAAMGIGGDVRVWTGARPTPSGALRGERDLGLVGEEWRDAVGGPDGDVGPGT